MISSNRSLRRSVKWITVTIQDSSFPSCIYVRVVGNDYRLIIPFIGPDKWLMVTITDYSFF